MSTGIANPSETGLPLAGGTLTGDLTLPATGTITYLTRTKITSSSDGIVKACNNAGTDASSNGLLIGNANTSGILLRYSSAASAAFRRGDDATTADLSVGNLTTATGGLIILGNSTRIKAGTSDGLLLATTSGSTAGDFQATPSALTVGTMTATNSALLRTAIHRFDWTNAMVVALGGSTAGDITVCTLPAKTIVKNAYVVITGTAAGVTTLTVATGRTSATYIDYVVASDAKAAANTVYGDASGERGTNLTGYDLPSFTGTTAVVAHFVSTGANLSAVTGSTGSIYLETYTLP